MFSFVGVRKAADLTKPIDKRVYKGTCPTCHDFGPPGCLKNEHVSFISHNIGSSDGLITVCSGGRDSTASGLLWRTDTAYRPCKERAF